MRFVATLDNKSISSFEHKPQLPVFDAADAANLQTCQIMLTNKN